MFCREWLAQLEQHHKELQAAGLTVAAIGLGEPKHAQRYCGTLAPSVTCLVNKSKEAYTAYGLRRGSLLQLTGPGVVSAALRAVSRGAVQGQATGDQQMIGGVFVIDQRGLVRYAYYDRHAGDHADFAEILCSVRGLSLRRDG
jgi:peroxiredoxin